MKRPLALSLAVVCCLGGRIGAAEVEAVKMPAPVYRPQVVVDPSGTIHVVYADAGVRGDIYYVKREADEFSAPVKVNSTPGCAAAFNMGVGKNGRVHVLIRPNAIYSKNKLGRQPKFNDLKYMLYCRLDDSGTRFEDERDLSQHTFGFEGVGAVIADERGVVSVYWHGLEKPGPESTRQIFLARSHDEGRTFSEPAGITTEAIGACACCSMQGIQGSDGRTYLGFRNSEDSGTKDSYLLVSTDEGTTFHSTLLEAWPDAGCPGSTYALTTGSAGTFIAWNTLGHNYFARAGSSRHVPVPTSDLTTRSPVLAVNAEGHVLFAWSEAANAREFVQGGSLAWQIFDRAGNPLSEKQGIARAVARWSAPAAYAKPNGDFVILYDGVGSSE